MYQGDPDGPATKRDLEILQARLEGYVEGFVDKEMQELEARLIERHEQLRAEVNHGYSDLVERITDSETRLLKAFYNFAQSNSKRMTELEGNEAAIRSRIGTIDTGLWRLSDDLTFRPWPEPKPSRARQIVGNDWGSVAQDG